MKRPALAVALQTAKTLFAHKRHLVFLTVLLLNILPHWAKANGFEELQKKMNEVELSDQLPRTMAVVFTTRKIAQDHVFTATDLEERQISIDKIPGDACVAAKKLVGRRSFTALNAHEVVSVQNLGVGLTDSQIASMTARDWSKYHEKMGTVCYAKDTIKPGEKFKSTLIVDHKMPIRIVPCDAVTNSSLIIGRKCKFGCAKRHIIMQHDVN